METLTNKQISPQDFVDNKIYELLNALIPPAKKLDWNIEIIAASATPFARKSQINVKL